MKEKQQYILIIAVMLGGMLLLMLGTAALTYFISDVSNESKKTADLSWFNGSRYINSTEGWAYVDLTFLPGLEGESWTVNVFGVQDNDREYINTRDTQITNSTNGVRLNLGHDRVRLYRCFDIEVSVGAQTQVLRTCLDEFEIR